MIGCVRMWSNRRYRVSAPGPVFLYSAKYVSFVRSSPTSQIDHPVLLLRGPGVVSTRYI